MELLEVQTCVRCRVTAPPPAFPSRGGRICKACKNEQNRVRRLTPEYKKLHLDLNRAHKERNREWLRKVKSHPCTDCGQTFPPYVMDFDHVGSDKVAGIAALCQTTHSLEYIQAEAAKCELVCSNCHRIRTWERAHAG